MENQAFEPQNTEGTYFYQSSQEKHTFAKN